ncbi:hypothetical protein HCA61_03755 [Rhodococcus sp. HNM0563]|uniref:hypothetical protein n=1 Tax=Rhodococcus sp. HNM0563 TaxID=2716339 RepID=UPI00146BE631|nr:hypothetical protein [Rhodococcus sp. HNM0563]NLU61375.1 hypothetical protein [Rhodococcus sp. HNM0563]
MGENNVGKGLNEAEISAKWAEIAPLIERAMERVGSRDEFPVSKGSSLCGDDRASDPYRVSHAVRHCVTAGVDHLHAAKVLVNDDRILHIAAPFSLARGALETLSAAYWIVHPTSRDSRIERTLRWHAQNFKDKDRALAPLSQPDYTPLEGKLSKLDAVADRRPGIVTTVRSGFTSTEVVKYADQNGVKAKSALLCWRLCSGYAHGRPWAYLGASERDIYATTESSVVNIKMTASSGTALLVVLVGLHLLEDVLRTYSQRASAMLDQIVGFS